MRIPAVAIAVAFAGGILLGRGLDPTHGFLGFSFLVIFFLLIAALLFAWRDRLWAAAIFSLLGWVWLGAAAMVLASQPLPAEHVLSRIAAGEIGLKTPLRWYGHLRSEPARLPWGVGLELELSRVETTEGMIPVTGGMRPGFTPKEGDTALPEVHAGDEVSVMTQARRPLVFRDAGAFDRREYLAQQNIHLLATLRASSLLERISTPPATMATRLARLRALLRERLDLRAAAAAMTARLSARHAKWAQDFGVMGLGWSLRGGEMMALSVALQFGMLPLMARDFHRVTVMGPVTNLLAVPLTGVIVPLGFFTLGGALVAPPLARVLAWPLGWLVALQGHVVGWFAGFAHGSYRIPGPPVWVTILFFGSGILLAAGLRSGGDWWKRSKWFAATGLFLASLVIATYPFPAEVQQGSLEVDVLDVAQGDSILVISPRGSTLLIDGGGRFAGFRGHEEVSGPDPGEEAVSAYLLSRGIQRLDAVALTHAHQDHIGGLKAVLENFQVRRLWLGRETETPALGQLKKLAEGRHIPIEHELRGQSFLWDGVQVDFLWPQIPPEEIAASAKNNDSLVVRLQYKERSVLLPGDAEKQAEYAMLSETEAGKLHADVLKVGHHGSKNSTMPEFLESVGPQIAIISAGEQNPYGHPSPELLERLRESGARILRTDEEGAVQVVTDGHSLRVSCFVGCGGEGLSQVSGNR
jgi:beta-lactamase superfamily II metal-dependent hydrolase